MKLNLSRFEMRIVRWAGMVMTVSVSACSVAEAPLTEDANNQEATPVALRSVGSQVPGRIQAENYDTGGEGVGYSTRRGDWGSAAPRKDSMDIGGDIAASGGYYIGWTDASQWFRYTLSVATAASFTLGFVVNSAWNSAVHATMDGVDVTGSVTLPPLAGGGYHTVPSKAFSLTRGTHVMKIFFEGSTPGLDAIDVSIVPLVVVPPVVVPPVVVVPEVPQTLNLHGHSFTYNPSMSDEFSATSLDTAKWISPYKGGVQRLNDEWECYTDNGTRVMTSNGLQLVGKKTGPNHAAADCGAPNYQSGLIRSTGQQKFGYFEASMKMPAGAGMWPAFWLIAGPNAANGFAPTWPPEIDILEMVNNGREGPFQVTQFLHGCGSDLDSSRVSSWGDYPIPYGTMNFADGNYHLFAAEWTPSQLYMYVDGGLARSYNFNWDMKSPLGNYGLVDPSSCSSYDNGPAELIVNLAMGGSWPGDIDDSVLPQALDIDYIRTYSY